jgi:hypothetical protein
MAFNFDDKDYNEFTKQNYTSAEKGLTTVFLLSFADFFTAQRCSSVSSHGLWRPHDKSLHKSETLKESIKYRSVSLRSKCL